jgi:hypothetical protein
MWNAAFYLGKRKEDAKEGVSVTTATVIELLSPLQGLNHRIHMDNYYTSVPLFQKLEQLFIWCTGTVRANRKGLDKEVCIKRTEHALLKKNPGYHRFSSYGSMSFVGWFDNSPCMSFQTVTPLTPAVRKTWLL